MKCDRCGEPVTPAHAWHSCEGWYMPRGATGGANQISMRKDTGRLMCNGCMVSLKAGHAPGQMGLGDS